MGAAHHDRTVVRSGGPCPNICALSRMTENREFPMRHVNLDKQHKTVKRFILSLSVEPEGLVLESEGRQVAWVVAPAPGADNGDEPWTDAKNTRRCRLIDRKYDGGLTAAEAAELARLQDQMLRCRQRVAPLPLEDARRLHQELLQKAAAHAAANE